MKGTHHEPTASGCLGRCHRRFHSDCFSVGAGNRSLKARPPRSRFRFLARWQRLAVPTVPKQVSQTARPGIVIWRLGPECKEEIRLPGQAASLESLAFTADGKFLAAGAVEKGWGIELWELASGQSKGTLATNGPVSSLAFSPNGKWLASGSRDATVRLWNLEDGKLLQSWPLSKQQTNARVSVAFSADSARLAGASAWENTVRVWDAPDWTEAAALPAGFEGNIKVGIEAVSFLPYGKSLMIATPNQVAAWDIKQQAAVGQPFRETNLRAAVLAPDGALAATTSGQGAVNIWSMATGRQVRSYPGSYGVLAISADSKVLASANDEGVVMLWGVGKRSGRSR
jgi:WD40 repeat protein